MEIVGKTIAVIIDFDNFNKEEHLDILFEELEQMGNVIYKGAFYSNSKDKKVQEKGIKYGINDFIVEPSYTKGKNAVDIRIALDVMEWLNKDYIDCFCLATNDSDFAPIIKKLGQKNKVVIGAGMSTSKEEYKKLCHRFISVDKIENAKIVEVVKKEQIVKKEIKLKEKDIIDNTKISDVDYLTETINLIIKNSELPEDGFIQFSVIIENLYKKMPDFNPKNYGPSSSKPSLFFKDKLGSHYLYDQRGKTLYIKMR